PNGIGPPVHRPVRATRSRPKVIRSLMVAFSSSARLPRSGEGAAQTVDAVDQHTGEAPRAGIVQQALAIRPVTEGECARHAIIGVFLRNGKLIKLGKLP